MASEVLAYPEQDPRVLRADEIWRESERALKAVRDLRDKATHDGRLIHRHDSTGDERLAAFKAAEAALKRAERAVKALRYVALSANEGHDPVETIR